MTTQWEERARNGDGHLPLGVAGACGCSVHRMNRRPWPVAVGAVLVLLVGAVVWLGLSARVVVAEMTAARDSLVSAQESVSNRDVDAASSAIASAAEHAASARTHTTSPIWGLAAAVPVLGATPETVRAVTTALDQAVGDMAPAVDGIVGLRPAALVGEDGSVDVAAISSVVPDMHQAQAGVSAALATLEDVKAETDGAFVVAQVEQARTELSDRLISLDSTLRTVVRTAEIAPPLLGADGPRRYFVGILNPNESRGVGGFLGTWAIVTADAGHLTIDEVGSNTDLPGFTTLPVDLGDDFAAYYGDGAANISNFNISPHFPDAAKLWLKSWEQKTGERLDGALAADVVALGQLVAASGGQVSLPDGGSLTGAELTEFALAGIYEKFPAAESVERKDYQVAVASEAVQEVTDGASSNPEAVASTLANAITERRMLAWVADEDLQARIIKTPLGGSLAVPDGPHVAFIAINSSMSKLDTYLERSVRYDVGRCPDESGRVRSLVTVTLTSRIPEGADLPAYVISQAEMGPDGPINSVLAQLHLPNGAKVLDVQVDGEPAAYSPFTEQGRTSLVLDAALPPLKARTITVLFDEPYVNIDPSVAEQPLALPQDTVIRPRQC